MKAKLFNIQGEPIKEIEISDYIFGIEPNKPVVSEVVICLRDNLRSGTACTRTRQTVSGSNRKPWPQKKWGYARAGSSRSPIWRGGSVIHGPQPRSYKKKILKKVRNLAIRSLYSDRYKEGNVRFVEDMRMDNPSTKGMNTHISNLIQDYRHLLYLTGKYRENENLFKSCNNLEDVTMMSANMVSALDLIKADYLLITEEGLDLIQKNLSREV